MNMDRKTMSRPSAPTGRDSFMPELDLGQTLREAVRRLRRHLLLVLGLPILAVAAAVVYALTATPIYTATGSLLIDPRTGQNPAETTQPVAAMLMSDALTVDSELRVLTSREVTGRAVRELGLEEQLDPQEPLSQRLRSMLGIAPPGALAEQSLDPDAQAARRLETARRAFVNALSVQRAGDSYVIDIAFDSPDVEFAAEAVNTVIRSYLGESSGQISARRNRTRDWLAGRIEELGSDVRAAETAIAEYQRENALETRGGGLLPSELALEAATRELVTLRGDLLAVRVRIGQLSEQIEAGEVEALQVPIEDRSPALTEYQTRRAALLQEERELQLSWEEGAPVLRSVRQRREQLDQLILEEYRSMLERYVAEAEGLERQVTANQEVIIELRDQYAAEAENAVGLRALEREAEAKRDLYERLLEEYNSSNQMASFDSSTARVIAWAVPPDSKSAPNSRQLVVLAAFAGIVLAAGLVILREALDDRFRRADELTAALGMRVLGLLPNFGSDRRAARRRGAKPATGANRWSWRRLPLAARRFTFAADWPASVTAEAMRTIHVRLSMLRGTDEAPGTGLAIGLTSAVRDEGKTTAAFNLANYLASRGERVVFVDLDLIAREATRLISGTLPRANMIGTLLEDPEAGLRRIEPLDDYPGLAVLGNDMGGGDRLYAPRDKEDLERLLGALKAHFDYIVVDLPPVRNAADTRMLATMCDHLVWVVRWGATPRDKVIGALHESGLPEERFLGALFTRARLGKYRAYNRHHEVGDYYA